MRRLILRSFQSPGDGVMLTAAVRDLHLAHPRQFETDVRTSADALWENNPFITRLNEGSPDVQVMDMHYPLIHQSNHRPYHFIHGYTQFLEEQLGLRPPRRLPPVPSPIWGCGTSARKRFTHQTPTSHRRSSPHTATLSIRGRVESSRRSLLCLLVQLPRMDRVRPIRDVNTMTCTET